MNSEVSSPAALNQLSPKESILAELENALFSDRFIYIDDVVEFMRRKLVTIGEQARLELLKNWDSFHAAAIEASQKPSSYKTPQEREDMVWNALPRIKTLLENPEILAEEKI
jgi:hypothetical protein